MMNNIMSVNRDVRILNIKTANVFHYPVKTKKSDFNTYIYILYYSQCRMGRKNRPVGIS